MVTNETDLPAVIGQEPDPGEFTEPTPRAARLPPPIPKVAPFSQRSKDLDDLIASIAADKAESDGKFAAMDEHMGKMSDAIRSTNDRLNDVVEQQKQLTANMDRGFASIMAQFALLGKGAASRAQGKARGPKGEDGRPASAKARRTEAPSGPEDSDDSDLST